jgi:Tfp pilus assembly protein PilF
MASHYERAQVLAKQGRHDLAISKLQQELAIDPNCVSTHALLAVCYKKEQQYAEAMAAIQTAINLAPDYAHFYYLQADLLKQQSQLQSAKTAITEALRLNPEEPDFYCCLGEIQLMQSKYEAALVTAKQGLQLDPKHIGCMNLKLLTLLQLGQLSQVETEIEAALAIAPDEPLSHAIYGWIALHRNQASIACSRFQEALRLQSDFEWARKGLIEVLKAQHPAYGFILQLVLPDSKLHQELRMLLSIIPLTKGRALVQLLISLGRSISTALLSFDAYGKLLLTAEERQMSRWHALGIVIFAAGFMTALFIQHFGCFLLPTGLWLAIYCLWRLFRIDRMWEARLKSGFLLAVAVVILMLAGVTLMPPDASALEMLAMAILGLITLTFGGFMLFVVGALIYTLTVEAHKLLARFF